MSPEEATAAAAAEAMASGEAQAEPEASESFTPAIRKDLKSQSKSTTPEEPPQGLIADLGGTNLSDIHHAVPLPTHRPSAVQPLRSNNSYAAPTDTAQTMTEVADGVAMSAPAQGELLVAFAAPLADDITGARGSLVADGTRFADGITSARGSLVADAARPEAGITSARGSLVADAPRLGDGITSARGNLVADAVRLEAGITSVPGSLVADAARLGDGIPSARGSLVADAARLGDGISGGRGSMLADGARLGDGITSPHGSLVADVGDGITSARGSLVADAARLAETSTSARVSLVGSVPADGVCDVGHLASLPAQCGVRPHGSIVGADLSVAELCAENKRLREEVERQRQHIESLSSSHVAVPSLSPPPPATRETPSTPATVQRLRVSIIRATGLKHLNLVGDSPWCACEVQRAGKNAKPSKCQTKSVPKTLDPVWNEVHDLDWFVGESLEFTIYDKGVIGSKVEGRVVVHSQQFYPYGFEGELPIGGLDHAMLSISVAPIAEPVLSGATATVANGATGGARGSDLMTVSAARGGSVVGGPRHSMGNESELAAESSFLEHRLRAESKSAAAAAALPASIPATSVRAEVIEAPAVEVQQMSTVPILQPHGRHFAMTSESPRKRRETTEEVVNAAASKLAMAVAAAEARSTPSVDSGAGKPVGFASHVHGESIASVTGMGVTPGMTPVPVRFLTGGGAHTPREGSPISVTHAHSGIHSVPAPNRVRQSPASHHLRPLPPGHGGYPNPFLVHPQAIDTNSQPQPGMMTPRHIADRSISPSWLTSARWAQAHEHHTSMAPIDLQSAPGVVAGHVAQAIQSPRRFQAAAPMLSPRGAVPGVHSSAGSMTGAVNVSTSAASVAWAHPHGAAAHNVGAVPRVKPPGSMTPSYVAAPPQHHASYGGTAAGRQAAMTPQRPASYLPVPAVAGVHTGEAYSAGVVDLTTSPGLISVHPPGSRVIAKAPSPSPEQRAGSAGPPFSPAWFVGRER